MELAAFADSTSDSVQSPTSKDYYDGLPQYSTLQSEGSSDLPLNGIEHKPIRNGIDHKSNGLDHKPNGKNHDNYNQKMDANSAQQSVWFGNLLRIKLFSGSSRGADRRKRIQSIMKSINSVDTHVPEYPADDGSSCCRINRHMMEYTLFVTGILVVAAICLTPVPLYYTAPVPPKPDTFSEESDAIKNCQIANINVCENHTSEACDIDLRFSQLSPLMMDDKNATESNLTNIFNITSNNPACSNRVKNFFCNASYRPCNSRPAFVPSVKDCEELEEICADEWDDIQRVSPVLADCSLYAPVICPDQFESFCGGICLAVCSEFSQNGEVLTVVTHVVFTMAGIFLIISGIFVFVVAFLKRKSVFHFPNVLILYISGTTMFYSIIQLMPLLGATEAMDYFYCSHQSLIVSFVEPTTFCQVHGFAFQMILMGFCTLWLLFVFHLFLKVVYPLRSQDVLNRHGTKIHIAEILFVLFASTITPIVTLTTDGFYISNFPPNQCYSDASVLFHGVLLPSMLIAIVGISVILLTILSVHRTTGLFKVTNNRRSCQLSVPEIKLMIISVYLTLVLAIGWIGFTISTHNDGIFDSIMKYSKCVANGDNSICDPLREDYQTMSMPSAILNIVFYLSMMLLNIMALLFVVQIKDVKRLARRVTHSFISTSNDL